MNYDQQRGLMRPEQVKPSQAKLEQVRQALGPANVSPSLSDALEDMSDAELEQLQSTAKMVRMSVGFDIKMNGQSDSYVDIVARMYPRMAAEKRRLLVALLQDLEPLSAGLVRPSKQQSQESVTASVLDDYNAILEAAALRTPEPDIADQLIASAREYSKPSQQSVSKKQSTSSPSQGSFMDRLIQSESSGNSQAEITIKDGRRFVGKLQFGAARLADYKAASGKRFTQNQFQADTALQDEVAIWHFNDIDKAIDALGDAGKGYNRDGLRSVAHLGGTGGMQRFVTTGGRYNPSDELGTSLKDYYNKFSKS